MARRDGAPGEWPMIPYDGWRDTCSALHLWLQIVGKYKLAHTPWVNHGWHATLYVTPRGLTTGPVPDPAGTIAVNFDLRAHRLVVSSEMGAMETFALQPMSVAEFHRSTREAIARVGGTPRIHHAPNELPEAVPFTEDTGERPYDALAVERFHHALLRVERVFTHFRTGFIGKVSPVHLFWGSFDLAVTRFSGRLAPLHPGGVPHLPDEVTQEAYSHEVSSAGFWPGGGGVDEAMLYSYAYPKPPGFDDWTVEPEEAYFHEGLGEFVLAYDVVREADDPDGTLMRFLETTYEAAAECGHWHRDALECPLGEPLRPRPMSRPRGASELPAHP